MIFKERKEVWHLLRDTNDVALRMKTFEGSNAEPESEPWSFPTIDFSVCLKKTILLHPSERVTAYGRYYLPPMLPSS